jgi:hypothetical protein
MSGPKEELKKSRDELLAVLDGKLRDLPEWRALRAVDGALHAINGASVPSKDASHSDDSKDSMSYPSIALRHLDSIGHPLTTAELVEYIGSQREIPSDPEKAKINIGSSFSKDDRLRNIHWRGGRAWWITDRSMPRMQSTRSAPREDSTGRE